MVREQTAAYPASAAQSATDLVIRIEVTVEPDGTVKRVHLVRSSGKEDADEAALAAAKTSRYSPASVNCAPVEGQYALTITFTAPVTKSSEFPPAL
jgi:TonB family protein